MLPEPSAESAIHPSVRLDLLSSMNRAFSANDLWVISTWGVAPGGNESASLTLTKYGLFRARTNVVGCCGNVGVPGRLPVGDTAD